MIVDEHVPAQADVVAVVARELRHDDGAVSDGTHQITESGDSKRSGSPSVMAFIASKHHLRAATLQGELSRGCAVHSPRQHIVCRVVQSSRSARRLHEWVRPNPRIHPGERGSRRGSCGRYGTHRPFQFSDHSRPTAGQLQGQRHGGLPEVPTPVSTTIHFCNGNLELFGSSGETKSGSVLARFTGSRVTTGAFRQLQQFQGMLRALEPSAGRDGKGTRPAVSASSRASVRRARCEAMAPALRTPPRGLAECARLLPKRTTGFARKRHATWDRAHADLTMDPPDRQSDTCGLSKVAVASMLIDTADQRTVQVEEEREPVMLMHHGHITVSSPTGASAW